MPVYPPVTINEQTYFRTIEAEVFIESRTGTAPAEEFIYVNFRDRLRWKQTGDCFRCGIADFEWNNAGVAELGSNRGSIVMEPGKSIGEKLSVKDLDYATRLDIPSTPDYDRLCRKNAVEIGMPYVCGLRFEALAWV